MGHRPAMKTGMRGRARGKHGNSPGGYAPGHGNPANPPDLKRNPNGHARQVTRFFGECSHQGGVDSDPPSPCEGPVKRFASPMGGSWASADRSPPILGVSGERVQMNSRFNLTRMPNGVLSRSPGLPGPPGYPGEKHPQRSSTLKGLRPPRRNNPFRVDEPWHWDPGVATAQQPWPVEPNPVGIDSGGPLSG